MSAVDESGSVTVQEVLAFLTRWQAQLLAGEQGLGRAVTWAAVMRARVPAFEGFSGGELALLSVPALRALSTQMVDFSLPSLVEQLADIGASAIAVAGLVPKREMPNFAQVPEHELAHALRVAHQLGLPLLSLSVSATTRLAEVEREVISHIVARRERPLPLQPAGADVARLHATLRGEALDALLTGTYAGEAAMRMRAAQLGHDLSQPHAVLWVDLAMAGDDTEGAVPGATDLRAGVPARTPHRADTLAKQLAEELTTALGAWALARDGHVTALLAMQRGERDMRDGGGGAPTAGVASSPGGVPSRAQPAETVARAIALLHRALGDGTAPGATDWSAGLGEPAYAPAQVHRSATEARDATRLGRILLGPRRVARPGDLGVYKLLLALRDSGMLAEFVERTLAPLRADSRTGDVLIETLEAFFACNGNVSQAKDVLHLHRNSLIYRLARARALLGHDLDDPELRLALQLAIKGRRILAL